nr:hypothetical protein [Bifidobacterium pseudocatenulatum]
MAKQKTIPELEAEKAERTQALAAPNTKSSNLKTVPHTTKREIGASGHIILSPVAQLLKALHR